MRLPLALLVLVSALVSCHRSSDSSSFLEEGVNDLGTAERLLGFADGIVAAAVFENGVDLNGDGDDADSLLEIVNLGSGNRTFVPDVAIGSGVTTGAHFVSFLVDEAAAGRDLNGDGDALDPVAHVYDARRGSTRNLHLATYSRIVQEGSLIAVGVHEEPGVDLDGDGEFHDTITHVYAADRSLLTMLPGDAFPDTLRIQGRRVICVTDDPETVQVYDADTGQLTTIDREADALWGDGSLLALVVPEWENGNQDLNGNGRIDDVFVELHDLETGLVRATDENDCWILSLGEELAVVALVEYPEPVEVRVYDRFSDTLSDPIGHWSSSTLDTALTSDRRHAYLVDEYEVGADLDGDGQQMDKVLHVFDARTGTTRSVGRASFSAPQIDAQRVAFLGLAEPRSERPPTHTSVHLLDLRTGVVSDLGLMASEFQLVDGRIVALTPEEWQGVDLDGDQQLTHTVLQVLDLASGETLDTGLTVWNFDDELQPIVLDGDVLALVVDGGLKAVRLR